MKIFVGITGASGVIYGVDFVRRYLAIRSKHEVHVCMSKAAVRVYTLEGECPTDRSPAYGRTLMDLFGEYCEQEYGEMNIAAKPASGSFGIEAAVVLPCSMNTLAKIAAGISDNLITRAVDVCLKEKRPVILCVRETPLNLGHLENMVRAERKGCTIMPIMHAFYTDAAFFGSRNFKEVTGVDGARLYQDHQTSNFCGRILDQLGIDNNLVTRW